MPKPFLKLVLFALLTGPLAAQSRPAEVELKDPGTAKRYAYYFSGAGHFYTGEAIRGGVMLGVTALGLYKFTDELGCSVASGAVQGDLGCSRGKAFLWLGLALAPYVYGIIDAPKSAERVNAGRRRQAAKLSFAPILDLELGRLQGGVRFTISH